MPTSRDVAAMLLEALPLSLRILGGAMHRGLGPTEKGLTMGQLRMLEMLHHRTWTLRDLAEHHHVSPSTMSRTVDVLVKRAWVDRRSDPRDRRQVILTLTGEGQGARAGMRRRAEENLERLVEQLSEEERAQLFAGLHVLQQLAGIASGTMACEHERHEGEEES
ncbi:MAG: hypothetical protein RLZZ387_4742 [Chloroflexota bacterium]